MKNENNNNLDSFGNSRLKKFLNPEESEFNFRIEENFSNSKTKNHLIETVYNFTIQNNFIMNNNFLDLNYFFRIKLKSKCK